MMRLFACGFIAGAWWLQQQAQLPEHPLGYGVLIFCGVLLGCSLSQYVFRRSANFSHRMHCVIRPIVCGVALTLAGFGSAYYWSAWRAELRLADRLSPALEQQDLVVQGVVISLPRPLEQGVHFLFRVEQAQHHGRSVHLPTQLSLGWYGHRLTSHALNMSQVVPQIQPGQRWQLTLRLKQPHGNANPYGFDYEYYLLEQHIGATGYVRPETVDHPHRLLDAFVVEWGTVIERVRYQLRRGIERALPDQIYRGVISALVLGDQNAIPQAHWQLFNATGISHLVSISGLHITMIAGVFAWGASFLWRRQTRLPLCLPAQKIAVLVGAVAALLYCLLAGWGVPAQRTFVMLLVVALALWLNRLTTSTHILGLAAVVVLLQDPWSVMAPGFWLSFFAVALIMLVLQRKPLEITTHGWRHSLREAGKVQLAITLGLAPLTLLLFQQISVIGPIANAIAIPLVSFLVTPLALLGAAGAALFPGFPFGGLLQLAHSLFFWLMKGLQWLADWPWAVWTAPTPSWWVFALALGGSVMVLLPRLKHQPWRWCGLLAWIPVFLTQPTQPPPGTLWLTTFDIGQGMALLVETQHHRLLYDTGPQYSPESDGGSRVLLPYFRARGIQQLDQLIVSHQDSDHAGGALSLLQGIRVKHSLTSLNPDHAIVQASHTHQPCRSGQEWTWDGVQFEMLHPDEATAANPALKPNAHSCVLQIRLGNQQILLAGDIEAAQEKRLVAAYGARLRSDVLLAPHHGSGTSSTPEFLQQVQPRIALFQVGYLNRYRHPKQEIWQRYAEFKIARERTDQAGALQLQVDGSTGVTLQRYREQHARYWYPQASVAAESSAVREDNPVDGRRAETRPGE